MSVSKMAESPWHYEHMGYGAGLGVFLDGQQSLEKEMFVYSEVSSDNLSDSDYDSDSDASSFTSCNENTQFVDEITELLKRCNSENFVYRKVVSELEEIRKANDETPMSLDLTVLRALLTLPWLLDDNCKNNLGRWAYELDIVLSKFGLLLKNFKHNREVLSTGLEVVELPFKQLATDGLINHEWLMYNGAVGEIFRVLNYHGIVDTHQWKELIHEVHSQIDLMSRHSAEEGNSQAGALTQSKENQFQQFQRESIQRQQNRTKLKLKKKQLLNLQQEEQFCQQEIELQRKQCQEEQQSLQQTYQEQQLSQGFICLPKSHQQELIGQRELISHDEQQRLLQEERLHLQKQRLHHHEQLLRYQDKLIFDQDRCLNRLQDHQDQRLLYHYQRLLHQDQRLLYQDQMLHHQNESRYCLENFGPPQKRRLMEQKSIIQMSTTKLDEKKNFQNMEIFDSNVKVKELEAVVYGKMYDEYILEYSKAIFLQTILIIHNQENKNDNSTASSKSVETFEQLMTSKQMKELDRKLFTMPHKLTCSKGYRVELELQLEKASEWKLCKNESECVFETNELMLKTNANQNAETANDIKYLSKQLLRGNSDNLTISSRIILMENDTSAIVSEASLLYPISYRCFIRESYPVKINETVPLSDMLLYYIAKEISPNYLLDLGLSLGLSFVEIEQIKADYPKSVPRITKVLCQWRDKKLCDDQPVDVTSELIRVLKKLHLPNAIRKLTSVA